MITFTCDSCGESKSGADYHRATVLNVLVGQNVVAQVCEPCGKNLIRGEKVIKFELKRERCTCGGAGCPDRDG